MNFRISGLLAITAFVSCFLASAQTLAQNAYITNALDNTVSVVSTATNTVTATIPVGVSPTGLAVSPDGSKVYVTNQGDDIKEGLNKGLAQGRGALAVVHRPQYEMIGACWSVFEMSAPLIGRVADTLRPLAAQ